MKYEKNRDLISDVLLNCNNEVRSADDTLNKVNDYADELYSNNEYRLIEDDIEKYINEIRNQSDDKVIVIVDNLIESIILRKLMIEEFFYKCGFYDGMLSVS